MTKSEKLFEKARQFIPGGVNSPVRAFQSVGGTDIFISYWANQYDEIFTSRQD